MTVSQKKNRKNWITRSPAMNLTNPESNFKYSEEKKSNSFA